MRNKISRDGRGGSWGVEGVTYINAQHVSLIVLCSKLLRFLYCLKNGLLKRFLVHSCLLCGGLVMILVTKICALYTSHDSYCL